MKRQPVHVAVIGRARLFWRANRFSFMMTIPEARALWASGEAARVTDDAAAKSKPLARALEKLEWAIREAER